MARSPWIVSALPKRLKPAGSLVHSAIRARRRRLDRLIAKWFPTPNATPVIPIAKFLEGQQWALLELQRRQYLLEALTAELSSATRGDPYWIHDDAAFRAVLDVDAMNVMDLCSWAVGTSDTDESLLLRVKEHYLAELSADRRWGKPDESNTVTAMNDKSHDEARRRLFPKAAGRALAESDIDDLIDSVGAHARPLKDDRNKNRAHAYENKTQGAAKMLDVQEVRELYRYARRLLNDLGLVALGSTWSETDITSNNVPFTAEDLVDMILLPKWFRREMAGRSLSRAQIYDALHADPETGHFNAQSKLERLADSK